jgi:peptidoglycan/LPS O-acetylase OafA/YrhL
VKYTFPDFTAPHASLYVIPAGVTVVFAIMALVATHKLSWLRWRGFTVLGMLTYPLYLVHQTISRTFVPRLLPHLNRWEVLAVLMTSALLTAYLIHVLIERPAQRWLRPRLRDALARIRAGGVLPVEPEKPPEPESESVEGTPPPDEEPALTNP